MKTRRQKQPSKRLDQNYIEKGYSLLHGADLIIFKILHLTGIRIGEVRDYVSLVASMKAQNTNRPILLQPQKKNNKRLIPQVITSFDLKLLELDRISLNESALAKRIETWIPILGEHASAHDFRATFISNALDKDINPIKVQNLMGHIKLDSTLRYLRLNTEHSLWMYDYITSPADKWTESNDVAYLKERLAFFEKKNAELLHKLKETGKASGWMFNQLNKLRKAPHGN